MRKAMVLVQFVASIVLIVGTGVVYSQMHFMQNSPLGVDIDQVLVVNGPNIRDSTYSNRFNQFRNVLLQYPDIREVTASSVIPGRSSRNGSDGVRLTHQNESSSHSCDVAYIDDNFVNALGLAVITGRNFSRSFKDNEKSVLLNNAALRMLGVGQPDKILGEKILVYGDSLKIVGVIKDYHQRSLKDAVEPLIFICNYDVGTFYSIKIKSANSLTEIANRAEAAFKESFQGSPFNHFFLDDYYNEQYKSEQQFGKVFGLFASIAIFIACLGLFGLSSYATIQRTKEIGIRKVLGASARQIGVLVSQEFVLIVLLANLISFPIAYFLMDNWLNNFANRIVLGTQNFLIPGLCALLIAIATVSSHAIKAANSDPVKNLRTD